ncbi:hypothetical protein [Ornithinimicrobium cavernae]|uniref:hypothetical protein n=1 Tax=Ornithinimicrobium cavernae TaxID=2666047 RepID=UPI000D6925F2|nr:hypothetical protein [Ornithinimicrobium cavernae]
MSLENTYVAQSVAAERGAALSQDLELRRRERLVSEVSRFGGHTRGLPALLTRTTPVGGGHPAPSR